MAIRDLGDLVGAWEMSVDLPGTEVVPGRAEFFWLGGGPILVQRVEIPHPNAPDSVCVIVANDEASFTQHYFDSRGVARIYDMTYADRVWTLSRTREDFSALEFQQRFTGRVSDDCSTIDGVWESSTDGLAWVRDFGLVYRRIG